jgi:hypothetical protein
MGITALERVVELGKKKLVIADHTPDAQQGIAKRGTVPLALNIRMLGKQLA